ncbi:hypothetical protein BDW22DRAFT_668896 [Trametopsis cervina]|nr:hypothetical protein BDW22DRAFT_668896 [Trametopsis cervina]
MSLECPICWDSLQSRAVVSIPCVTSDKRRKIPAQLREYAHEAIRRVFMEPATSDGVESLREMDYLWTRLEQLQHLLEQSKTKESAAEDKVATLTKDLSQAREENKKLQSTVTSLQNQQQRRQQREKSPVKDGAGSNVAGLSSVMPVATSSLEEEMMAWIAEVPRAQP